MDVSIGRCSLYSLAAPRAYVLLLSSVAQRHPADVLLLPRLPVRDDCAAGGAEERAMQAQRARKQTCVLLLHQAKANANARAKGDSNVSCVHAAAARNLPECVDMLLKVGRAQLEPSPTLHHLVHTRNGFLPAQNGANVNATSCDPSNPNPSYQFATPLHLGAVRGW